MPAHKIFKHCRASNKYFSSYLKIASIWLNVIKVFNFMPPWDCSRALWNKSEQNMAKLLWPWWKDPLRLMLHQSGPVMFSYLGLKNSASSQIYELGTLRTSTMSTHDTTFLVRFCKSFVGLGYYRRLAAWSKWKIKCLPHWHMSEYDKTTICMIWALNQQPFHY